MFNVIIDISNILPSLEQIIFYINHNETTKDNLITVILKQSKEITDLSDDCQILIDNFKSLKVKHLISL